MMALPFKNGCSCNQNVDEVNGHLEDQVELMFVIGVDEVDGPGRPPLVQAPQAELNRPPTPS